MVSQWVTMYLPSSLPSLEGLLHLKQGPHTTGQADSRPIQEVEKFQIYIYACIYIYPMDHA